MVDLKAIAKSLLNSPTLISDLNGLGQLTEEQRTAVVLELALLRSGMGTKEYAATLGYTRPHFSTMRNGGALFAKMDIGVCDLIAQQLDADPRSLLQATRGEYSPKAIALAPVEVARALSGVRNHLSVVESLFRSAVSSVEPIGDQGVCYRFSRAFAQWVHDDSRTITEMARSLEGTRDGSDRIESEIGSLLSGREPTPRDYYLAIQLFGEARVGAWVDYLTPQTELNNCPLQNGSR